MSVHTQIVQTLHQSLGSEHLVHTLSTAHHEEVVNLLVQLVGFGEHTIVGCLHVEVEDSTAEGSQV